MGKDANDIYREFGVDALRNALAKPMVETDRVDMLDPNRELVTGSEAEVASRVIENLRRMYEHVVFSEGGLYVWNGKHWQTLYDSALLKFLEPFDGQFYHPEDAKNPKMWRLGDKVRRNIQSLIELKCEQRDFFSRPAIGVNLNNGFIEFSDDQFKLEPHQPEHKMRHVLEITWTGEVLEQPPKHSILFQLLNGCFTGDDDAEEKIAFLAEVCAAAVLNYGTRLSEPKAVLLYGPSAANGKSTLLDLFRQLIPTDAQTSLTPYQMNDERLRVFLSGAMLNAADELGEAAIRSDTFKAIITGNEVTARQLYKPGMSFRPTAQHLFATNVLPPFETGMDPGILRRLAVIRFNRPIPKQERIPDIVERIQKTEADLLISWVMSGAMRLAARGRFPDLSSSQYELEQWIKTTDPIAGWLNDSDYVEVTGDAEDFPPVSRVYESFAGWCDRMGIAKSRVDPQPTLTRKLTEGQYSKLAYKRTAKTRGIVGLRLNRPHHKRDANEARL